MIDAVELEVFRSVFTSVADEMGVVLKRSSFSPNIKERQDYSCALFDPAGRMIAQAAHIPVHLGSMPRSVDAVRALPFEPTPGDVIVLNDPFHGGTHLPDITFVKAVFTEDETLLGYVANRAHHADVGGMAPGSMPISDEIFQEGINIPPVRLVKSGRLDEEILGIILNNVRTPGERRGDILAQLSSLRRGEERLQELNGRYATGRLHAAMAELLDYSERLTRGFIAGLADGTYRFEDSLHLNEDTAVAVKLAVTIDGDELTFDFSGTAKQIPENLNTVLPVTESCIFYLLLCLVNAPANTGVMRPVTVRVPGRSLLAAEAPAAVCAGNVETSQRIIDVLMGAFAKICPGRIPAAAQGTMNNISFGGRTDAGENFAYYETLAGGAGAGSSGAGQSGVHTHMTNTMNTPVEALEFELPVRVTEYSLRTDSGGPGKYPGGDGIVRELEFLNPARVNLLTSRRYSRPFGLNGGEPGLPGQNFLRPAGSDELHLLAGRAATAVQPGDRLRIETPGGGGYGQASVRNE